VLEDYVGPVLYEGEAAGRWLSEAFVPHLSAGLMWGGEFEKRIGQPVLPKGVSVIDDPRATQHAGLALLGGYQLDVEGEAAQKVELVADGKLVGLLAARTPSKKIKKSNGHARGGMPGMGAQAGIANLVVQSKRGLADTALEKKLMELVRKRGLDSGLVVRRTAGAHRPTIAMRLHKDGRRELVRVGFVRNIEPRTLREIVAFGKTPVATHHMLSGAMPMSWRMPAEYAPFVSTATIVAPSLLVGELELHRDKGGNPKPPSYPRPTLAAKP
jgi:hypothetical protein